MSGAPSRQPAGSRPGGGRPRTAWHVWANAVVVAYLALAVLVVLLGDTVDDRTWLSVHLLLLGGASNAIVVWGEHFTAALLGAPRRPTGQTAGLLATLNVGVVAVLVGVTAERPGLTVAASVGVGVAACWYVVGLARSVRRARRRRWATTVWFYVAAACALLVGAGLGAALSLGRPWAATVDPRHEALRAAHVHVNLLGWVGLTILGTLFTLWPTVLRTRMVDGVMRDAARCLSLCVAGLTVAVTGLAAGARWVAAPGLCLYAAGVVVALRPFVATWRQKSPFDAATWSMAAATGWLLVSLAGDLVLLVASAPDRYGERLDALLPALAVGFVGQMMVGALTYLVPVVVGGGPSRVRGSNRRLAWGWPARVLALNVGVALLAAPGPAALSALGWLLVLVPAAVFLGLVAGLLATARPSAPAGPASG